MTRFKKKELIKAGVQLEETLPYMPYDYMDTILVHAESCEVAIYDMRIGWYWTHYDRQLRPDSQRFEDDDLNDCLTIGM